MTQNSQIRYTWDTREFRVLQYIKDVFGDLSHDLALMLLVVDLAITKLCENDMPTLANGCSSDSARQELSNEYQHDRI